jgi:hypothetical protein
LSLFCHFFFQAKTKNDRYYFCGLYVMRCVF